MAKKSQTKLLLIAITLSILTCAIYTSTAPTAQASEATLQEKGLTSLNLAFNLDLTKYSVSTKAYPSDPSVAYFGVVPQESVGYSLTSENSKLKLQYTFGNGKIQMIQVLEKEGTPSLTKATSSDTVEAAKNFLISYQNYTANPLFGDLKNTLTDLRSGRNVTKTTGDITLEMNTYDDYTHFKWYYSSNGAIAPYTKYITMVFKDGFLTDFVDNWQFFNVGSTSINLSEKEAITIALNAAKEHAHNTKLDNYGFEEANLNESNVRFASLIFDNSLSATNPRSKDTLELYPTWRIGIALDKWYGQLYGIQVNIWADNKEIRSIQEAWSSVPPPENAPIANITLTQEEANQTLSVSNTANFMTPWIALSIFTTVSISATALVVYKKKQVHTSLKLRSLKTSGIMLSLLMLSILFLTTITPVNAWTKTAVIWGSESSGADDYSFHPPDYNWRKSAQERQFQRDTSVYLTNWFENYGNRYTTYNHQGHRNPGSTKLQILNNDIDIHTATNSRVAFVTFDHGVGNYINGEFHFMFEDQTGTGIGTNANHYWDPSHGVYDEEVYNTINPADRGKTILAFINTCMSSRTTDPQNENIEYQGLYNGRARSLPFAFTGRTVHPTSMQGFTIGQHMSSDGYGSPDDGSQVYIGFPKGSASCEQLVPYPGSGGNYYYYWVVSFFYNAVYADLSINQALDAASNQFMGGPFSTSPLRTGFAPYWWNFQTPPEWSSSTLSVYGNGRIRLNCYGDDFQDGNYYGWTVNQGSWTAGSAKLVAQQGNSLIHTDNQFTNARHVRTQVRTISAGANSWDTAWVIAKHDSTWNNMVYALIHTNGNVELSIFRNGQKLQWNAYAGVSPFATNTIDVDIVGTKAYVWVNGQLYIEANSDWFDDFSGTTALYTNDGSTAEFDDITVVAQS